LCSIAGAGTGFFAGFVIVQIFLQILARETVPDNTGHCRSKRITKRKAQNPGKTAGIRALYFASGSFPKRQTRK
jgi:hypothetical protein